MESKNRNILIVLAFVVVVLCLCAVAVVVLVAGSLFVTRTETSGVAIVAGQARTEQTFDVGAAPNLRIDNFAGSVTVRAGDQGQIRLVATRRASRAADLARIQVAVSERDGGLVVETTKPFGLSNASVQIEIAAPADTYLDLHTGSGSVDVAGIHGGAVVDTGSGSVTARDLRGTVELHTGSGSVEVRDMDGGLQVDSGSGSLALLGVLGDIDAFTGSGSIDVRGARGAVHLDTGSGSLDFDGIPQGGCRFETGTGSIVLHLPADLDADVELETGSGTVSLQFPVDGTVSRSRVEGIIGGGQQVSIYAHTGTGNIDVVTR
ncbi:MAG: DUF4097 family beta strand repeat-containing protein [Anaerolineae bacterium]|jgi:hypothetical protein